MWLGAVGVGKVRRIICASPEYLARAGTPSAPHDLVSHTIVSASSVTPNPEWKLPHKGEPVTVRLHARMTTSTNDSAVTAALGGLGLTRLLSYQVADHLQSGRLQAVLSEFEPSPLPIHVVHREGRQAPQRVRAFLDLAIERLRQNHLLQQASDDPT